MIGGDTIFGKITSFMELGFTYQEVLKMPLRNLAMHQSDEIRIAHGEVKREMTEDEEKAFIAKKMKG